ncbi:hypothetical protein ACFY05_31765 [Microtetraspora fusca]|uniref:Uncharacterized protein n=1 Tax=Microtetraspora fusca TaxID=1997 RepID=A0ABW6VH66_MICFU
MLYRGDYRLDETSQETGTDWSAELISRHFSGHTIGYCRTDGEIIIYAPGSPAEWLRFTGWQALQVWLFTYDCTVERQPYPGASFVVDLPADDSGFEPLTDKAA